MTDAHEPLGEADELAELRALASRLGPDRSEPDWDRPPEGLWDRIAADVGVPSKGAATGRVPESAIPGTVVSMAARRRLPWVIGAVAAAIVLIVGAIALVREPSPEPTVLATAPLDRLGPTGSGSAKLVDTDGEVRLRVETADLDPGDGFLEVWLIDEGVTKLVSLGPIRSDGTYDLPAGLDPEAFPVVDVSVEPLDGDPNHSGDSLLRGQLIF